MKKPVDICGCQVYLFVRGGLLIENQQFFMHGVVKGLFDGSFLTRHFQKLFVLIELILISDLFVCKKAFQVRTEVLSCFIINDPANIIFVDESAVDHS